MCNFKSALILKDSVFVPNYDSHDDMLKELKIKDTKENAERLFVRAELVPPRYGSDMFETLKDWKFVVDQDILPDWFVPEIDEQRMRKAVSEWAEKHMFVGKIGKESLNFFDDDVYYVKDCSAIVYGKARIHAYGYSMIKANDNSTVIVCDNSAVIAYNKVTVGAFNHSVVYAHDFSEVHAADESSIYAYDNSKIHSFGNSTVESHDNSVVEDYSKMKINWYDEEPCFCNITKR